MKCKLCGKEFEQQDIKQKYCSLECQRVDDNVYLMDVENEKLKFDCGDFYYKILLNSSEKAHQARRLIESAYAHGEKICKI